MKQEGFFQCQNCGTKYTLEEARKIFLAGQIDVSGSTIQIDETEELNKLYTLARRAKDERDYKNQEKYYNMILEKDPNSWEAYLYGKISQQMDMIKENATQIHQAVKSLIGIINNHVTDPKEKTKAIKATYEYCKINFNALYKYAKIKFDKDEGFKSEESRDIRRDLLGYAILNIVRFHNIFGDSIEENNITIPEIKDLMITSWKYAIQLQMDTIPIIKLRRPFKHPAGHEKLNSMRNYEWVQQYATKIHKYDPSYQSPLDVQPQKTSGLFSKLFE
ncbi:MAG: hypothetical protein K6F61_02640 [Clostridiales bacterium]|nr:hypothetical protein [Clostridiales bacterium]